MEKIQIQCSSCGQKFAVNESYKNRMVECGSCNERFKVDDSSILKKKKRHFPGDKAAANAAAFSKIPSDSAAQKGEQAVDFQTAQYADTPNISYATSSPKRTIAMVVGAAIITLFIVIFLLGGREGGMLENMDQSKRLILAIFIALSGAGLIIYGCRHRIKGVVLAFVLAAALIAMPIIFPAVLPPAATQSLAPAASAATNTTDDEGDIDSDANSLSSYSDAVGFHKAIKLRAARNTNPEHIKAIVLRDAERQIDTILTYLKRQLLLDTLPSTYSSGRELAGRPVILVVFESDISTAELFLLTKKFGTPQAMNEVRNKLDVIEVITSITNSPDKNILVNQNHPQYFSANFQELHSIDRSKQLNAILRLNNTTVTLGRRADISTALANIISVYDAELSEAAIRALYKFTLPEYMVDAKVLAYATNLSSKGRVPNIVLDYLIDKKIDHISPILAQQWSAPNGPLRWEDQLIRAKAQGEKAIISSLPNVPTSHFKSASLILKKIGTSRSIPCLKAAAARANKEDAKYLKATIDEIKSRQ